MEPQGLPAQLSTWVLNHVLWIDEDYTYTMAWHHRGLVLALLCGTARAFFNVEVGPSGASGASTKYGQNHERPAGGG